MCTLSTTALPELAELAAVPGYDRGRVRVGVVHVGVGNFHRSHQAIYLDRLMEETGELEWGICGVGVLEGDRGMRDALAAQDLLYTVVEKHGDGTERVRVVGSVVEYLFGPEQPDAVIERMASEAVRIVTLTITEGGYAERSAEDDAPWTAFGLITEALHRRWQRGLAPFAVVSCDNLQGNGRLACARVTALARQREPDFSAWIEREARFPGTMVDRITAVTTDEDRAELAERHGIDDRWPVVCEPFAQWVVEDAFPAGRPPLEAAGVQLVADVEPYELMKLRLLNGGHQALGYLAYLAGHRLVHEAAQDPPFRDFLRGYLDEEVTPTLAPVPGIDLDDYKETLLERFSNPAIRDTLARVCASTSDRIPAAVLPVVRRRLETGGDVRRAAAVVAAWARYAEGTDEAGEPIDVVDARRDELTRRARRARTEPDAFLEDRAIFGDLAADERLAQAYRTALASLHEHGARATVQSLVAAHPTHDASPRRIHG